MRTWPLGFIPEHVEIEQNWIISIYAKMSAAWMEYKATLKNQVARKETQDCPEDVGLRG